MKCQPSKTFIVRKCVNNIIITDLINADDSESCQCSCNVVHLKQDLMSFSLEKLLSASATVTVSVRDQTGHHHPYYILFRYGLITMSCIRQLFPFSRSSSSSFLFLWNCAAESLILLFSSWSATITAVFFSSTWLTENQRIIYFKTIFYDFLWISEELLELCE